MEWCTIQSELFGAIFVLIFQVSNCYYRDTNAYLTGLKSSRGKGIVWVNKPRKHLLYEFISAESH